MRKIWTKFIVRNYLSIIFHLRPVKILDFFYKNSRWRNKIQKFRDSMTNAFSSPKKPKKKTSSMFNVKKNTRKWKSDHVWHDKKCWFYANCQRLLESEPGNKTLFRIKYRVSTFYSGRIVIFNGCKIQKIITKQTISWLNLQTITRSLVFTAKLNKL